MAEPDQWPGPAVDGVWDRFQAVHGPALEEWLRAEKHLAGALASGIGPATAGDQLLAAEASLQGAIIDFASTSAEGDPTSLALILLRLAEARLAAAPDGPKSPASEPAPTPSEPGVRAAEPGQPLETHS